MIIVNLERNCLICWFWHWCGNPFTRPYICDLCQEIHHSAVVIIEDPLLCLEFYRVINAVYQCVVVFVELSILHL